MPGLRFSMKHWVTGKAGPLGNNTGTARVGEFGDLIGENIEYPKFGHL